MATATYPGSSSTVVTTTKAATFIPEIWSDEVVAAYKKKIGRAHV